MGRQGDRVAKNGDLEVWSRPLADGGRAVVLLNRSGTAKTVGVKWQELGYPAGLTLHVRDLWKHQDKAMATGSYEAQVAPHGVMMIRLTM